MSEMFLASRQNLFWRELKATSTGEGVICQQRYVFATNWLGPFSHIAWRRAGKFLIVVSVRGLRNAQGPTTRRRCTRPIVTVRQQERVGRTARVWVCNS
jgi:hypothetical protein